MRSTPTFRRIVRLLLWAAVAAAAVHLAVHTIRALRQPSHGFVANYAAGRLVLEGADAARFADDTWFAAQVRRFEPTVTDIFGANLPTTPLYMTVLATGEYRTSRAIWAGASYVALLALLAWLARRCRLGPWLTPLFLTGGLFFQPVRENLLHAQMYVAILALAVLAWTGYRRSAAARTGVPIGVLLTLKSFGVMFWPMLVALRRWHALAWASATAAALVLLSLAIFGSEPWIAWARVAATLPDSGWVSVTAYQTATSFIRHLLVYDARWNPQPLLHLPTLASMLQYGVVLALLGATCAVAWVRPGDDRVFAAFTLLTLILSPVSLDYHYVVALLPIAIILGDVGPHPRSAGMVITVVASALIALDLPYRSPALSTGALALLAYPKLYGACLLWGLALWRAMHTVDRRGESIVSITDDDPDGV